MNYLNNNTKRQPALPLVLCAVFMILARISGIAYSFFATDTLYRTSMICDIFQATRQIFSSVSFALGAGSAVWNMINNKKITVPVVVSGAVLLADSALVIVYDLIEGSLKGRVFLGIFYRSSLFAYSIIMLLVGLFIANSLLKHKKSKTLAAVIAAALVPAIDLAYALWNYLDSLIEWEFLPTSDEVYTMVYEGGTLVLCTVLSALASILIVKKYKGKTKSAKTDGNSSKSAKL